MAKTAKPKGATCAKVLKGGKTAAKAAARRAAAAKAAAGSPGKGRRADAAKAAAPGKGKKRAAAKAKPAGPPVDGIGYQTKPIIWKKSLFYLQVPTCDLRRCTAPLTCLVHDYRLSIYYTSIDPYIYPAMHA